MNNEKNNRNITLLKKTKRQLYNITYLLSLLAHFIAGLLAIYGFVILIGVALEIIEFKKFVFIVVLTIISEAGGRTFTFLGDLLIPPHITTTRPASLRQSEGELE